MIAYRFSRSRLGGTLGVPPSKSHTLRAILFASLAKGASRIYNPLCSPDTDAMVGACRLLGAQITVHDDHVEVRGGIKETGIIDAGNSGQVLRFVGGVAALLDGYTVITGDASICHNRPVQPLLRGLTQLGAFAASLRGDGHAPIVIRGPLKGGYAVVSGEDSQPISALLMGAAFAPAPTELVVENPGEKPWVALTLRWFDRLGIRYRQENFSRYFIEGGSQIDGFSYTVPADLSSLSYPVVAAILTDSELEITDVDLDDVQGDREVIFLLQRMGANIAVEGKRVRVKRGSSLQGRKIDVNNFIDSVPLLAVVGCFAVGETEVFGGKIARSKESDRISTIVCELQKMGADIVEREDGFIVRPATLHEATLEAHADHRIALSLAVAAMAVGGVIEGAECVAKSYGSFFDDMRKVGANVKQLDSLRV